MIQQTENINLSEELFKLLAKYLQLETSADETQQVENWLEENPQNTSILLQLSQLMLNTDRGKATMNVDIAWEKLGRQIEQKKESKVIRMQTGRFKIISWVAACAFVVFGAAVAYKLISAESSPSYYKGLASVKLKDGTTVELEQNGELMINNDYNRNDRQVTLKGNGSFDVVKDSKRPFIINMDGRMLTVLGTSFRITQNKVDSNYFNIKVTEGVVKVNDSVSKNEYKLIGGQELSFSKVNKEIKVFAPVAKLKFDNVSLLTILNEMGKIYRIQFQNIPPLANQLFYTIDMSSEPLDTALHTLSILAEISIEKISDSVYKIK